MSNRRLVAVCLQLQLFCKVGFVRWVLCALQMCCNVRLPMRDFELNVVPLEGKRNFVLGLRTTHKCTKVLPFQTFRFFTHLLIYQWFKNIVSPVQTFANTSFALSVFAQLRLLSHSQVFLQKKLCLQIQFIQRAYDAQQITVTYMQVTHGCFYTVMPK